MEVRFGGPARAARFAAALALVACLAVHPAVPSPVAAMGSLPACRFDDILTSPRQYTDWSMTLVDTILRVPSTYAPPDLVRVSDAGIAGKGRVRGLVIEDLRAMAEAAAAADAAISVTSAYRSYSTQQSVFRDWVGRYGYQRAAQISARPGHSEHQLGLAIDFSSDPPEKTTLTTDWAMKPAGKWMKAHAWEFGFVMSYPKGQISLVCYDWEPWHFRYVGRDIAAAIHASGMTPREYLWSQFTTTVVPGKTHDPGSPAVSPPPSGPPSSSPAPTSGSSEQPTVPPTVPPLTLSPGGAPTELLPPTPAASEPPTTLIGAVQPGVVAGVGLALAAAAMVIGWMVLRRRGAP